MRTKSDDDRFKQYLFMVIWLIIATPMLWMANPGYGIASLLLWLVAVYPVYKSIRQPTQDPAPGRSPSPSPHP
jgi:hypothetical protein